MKITRKKNNILWFKLLINHSLSNVLSSSSSRIEATRLFFLKNLRKTFKIWLIKNLVFWFWFLENAMSRRRFTTFFDDISRTKSSIKKYSLSAIIKKDETSNVRSSLIINVRILNMIFFCVCDCWRLSRLKKNTWSQWNAWLKSHKFFSQKYFTNQKNDRWFIAIFYEIIFASSNKRISVIRMSKFVWIINDVDHIDMKIYLNIKTQNHVDHNSSIKKMHFFLDWFC
jgi:hypothetical protein